jgi:predicted RecA/RadA family phage recombinase
MATNSAFANADQLSLPVAEGVESGDPVIVEQLVGVALTDRGAEGNPSTHATVKLTGAFHLPVTTTSTLDIGDPVYITDAGVLTPAAGDTNALFGHALEEKGAGNPETIAVRLVGHSTTPLAAS